MNLHKLLSETREKLKAGNEREAAIFIVHAAHNTDKLCSIIDKMKDALAFYAAGFHIGKPIIRCDDVPVYAGGSMEKRIRVDVPYHDSTVAKEALAECERLAGGE